MAIQRRNGALILAIWLFWGLALNSMVRDSPTMDEQNHLTRGYAFLMTGDPRLSLEHPPLVNTLSALPLLLLPDLHLDTSSSAWQEGQWYAVADAFLWETNHDVTRMIFLARLPIVLLGLALGLAGYWLGYKLWGRNAAAFTFIFLLFDPNLLAHTRYTTTDLGGTLFLLLVVGALWNLWGNLGERKNGQWLMVNGQWSTARNRLLSTVHRSPFTVYCSLFTILGCTFASKLSTLGFVPIFFVLAVLPLYGDKWSLSAAARRVGQLILAGALSLLVIWAIFGFEWGPYRFRSTELPWLMALNEQSGPLPTFAAGLEQMVLLGQDSGRPTFLLGKTSVTGFPLYFPIAFLVKTPLVTLVGGLVAAFWLIRRRESRGRALFLLLPALLFFFLMTQSSLNIGYRHLLPLLPFIYLLIGGVAGDLRLTIDDLRFWQRHPQYVARHTNYASCIIPLIPWVTALTLILAALWLYPSYLGFFNLLGGGPANGYNILVDSNVDWGQDLRRLQGWMVENQVGSVKLAWFGSARPEYYGIVYEPLPGSPHNLHLWWDVPFDPLNPPDGVYAISASMLWELPLQDDKHVFTWFRAQEPTARIGSSVFIYQVQAGSVIQP
ncbi:MAG: hypothetical protein V9G20_00360 [Candidatus Promineifilaceae bacterium]